jgi:hypothetical protein
MGLFHIRLGGRRVLVTTGTTPYLIYGRLLTEDVVSLAAQPRLEPGKTYRTRDLRQFGANPARLARRLLREGKLQQAARGLFYAPVRSRFGQAPPSEEELLRGFLGNSPFVITGPPRWNILGLGATAMFAATLVYNKKRSGEFNFDGCRFILRRVYFPEHPTPEWYIIDLLQHHDMAGVSIAEIEERLAASLHGRRWDRNRLREMAMGYGTRATVELVERSISGAGRAR